MAYARNALIDIARLYYRDEYTHAEIASRLGLTRTQVTRMLQAARERGVVNITIEGEADHIAHTGLSGEMALRFGLRKALIVPAAEGDAYERLDRVAQGAGAYIDSAIKAGDTVGVGWGMSVACLVRNFLPAQRRDVRIVPLLGGLDERDHIFNLPELGRAMAEKLGGSANALYAPAIVDAADVRATLMSDSSIRAVVELWDRMNVLVMGIGALRSKMPQALLRCLARGDVDLPSLGIVGDLCFNFLDDQGCGVRTAIEDRIIGVRLGQIRRTPLAVAVAVGEVKAAAIHAALWSGCVDVLVTDENTACAVLDIDKP